MCHPTGQITDGFHFLRLQKLTLNQPPLGDVLRCSGETADDAVRVDDRAAIDPDYTHFSPSGRLILISIGSRSRPACKLMSQSDNGRASSV